MLGPEDYWDLDETWKKRKEKNRIAKWFCILCIVITLGSCVVYWEKFQLWPCLFFLIGVGYSQANEDQVETDIDLSILSGKIRARNREREEKERKEKVDNQ